MLNLLDQQESSGIRFMLFLTEDESDHRPFWLGGFLQDQSRPRDDVSWKWNNKEGDTLEIFRYYINSYDRLIVKT